MTVRLPNGLKACTLVGNFKENDISVLGEKCANVLRNNNFKIGDEQKTIHIDDLSYEYLELTDYVQSVFNKIEKESSTKNRAKQKFILGLTIVLGLKLKELKTKSKYNFACFCCKFGVDQAATQFSTCQCKQNGALCFFTLKQI